MDEFTARLLAILHSSRARRATLAAAGGQSLLLFDHRRLISDL